MKRNKLTIFIIFIISFVSVKQGFGQINMVYSIGCVGNTNATQPVYSGAIAVDGKACFNLSNGVNTFEEGKSGLFTNNCEVVPSVVSRNVIQLNLRVFPNPVISTVTVKSLDVLQVTDALLVTVYNMSGQLVKNTKTNFNELGRGFTMDLSNLRAGVYVLKVSSPTASAEYKLIKVD